MAQIDQVSGQPGRVSTPRLAVLAVIGLLLVGGAIASLLVFNNRPQPSQPVAIGTSVPGLALLQASTVPSTSTSRPAATVVPLTATPSPPTSTPTPDTDEVATVQVQIATAEVAATTEAATAATVQAVAMMATAQAERDAADAAATATTTAAEAAATAEVVAAAEAARVRAEREAAAKAEAARAEAAAKAEREAQAAAAAKAAQEKAAAAKPAVPVPAAPTPVAPAANAAKAPAAPIRLRIPKIGVSAAIEYVSTAADGTMAVPKNEWNVAWYKFGYVPGTPGNAVIDGHLDWTHGPAVFWNLGKLKKGDPIFVKDKQGMERKFIITEVAIYPFNDAPLNRIFGPSSSENLNLITCNGSFDRKSQNYNKRLVVYSTLAK